MVRKEVAFIKTGELQWETKYEGQTYLISKIRPGEWHLYRRVHPTGPATWESVREIRSATAGHQPIGSSLHKARQNTALFLVFGVTPDDTRWED